MTNTLPSDEILAKFAKLLHQLTGNRLASNKKNLLSARLNKRLTELKLKSYDEYYKHLISPENSLEVQAFIDAMTTNETHFFRENKHFTFFEEQLNEMAGTRMVRVWSAACSTGQEPYSIAFTLEESPVTWWQLVATDINKQALSTAQEGIYPKEMFFDEIPQKLRFKYCSDQSHVEDNKFRVKRSLISKIQFKQANLNKTFPEIGTFDFIFLRNVLIYFSDDDIKNIITRVTDKLKNNGYLFLGHSESIGKYDTKLRQIAPTVYQYEH